MKYISAVALLLVSTQAVQLERHHHKRHNMAQIEPLDDDTEEKMHYYNHWRKDWPEGVDNSEGDADVLNGFSLPKKAKKEKPKELYPWSYDKDVISTGKSIDTAEDALEGKLSYQSVALHKGTDMFSEKDYYRAAEPSPNTWLGRAINEGKEKHVEPDAEKEGTKKEDKKEEKKEKDEKKDDKEEKKDDKEEKKDEPEKKEEEKKDEKKEEPKAEEKKEEKKEEPKAAAQKPK